MASFYTNRGLKLIQAWALRNQTDTPPATFYLALVTDTNVPDVDTNVLGDLEEIDAGNGYVAGGQAVTCDDTGFPDLEENDDDDLADCTMRAVTWTPTGGQIPATGDGPSYAVLTTDEVTVADRQVIFVLDLDGEQVRATGIPLTVGAISRGEHP